VRLRSSIWRSRRKPYGWPMRVLPKGEPIALIASELWSKRPGRGMASFRLAGHTRKPSWSCDARRANSVDRFLEEGVLCA
jgi:hypothetical protein